MLRTSDRIELLATLWPEFPHFGLFLTDKRLSGIRINPAMIGLSELERVFSTLDVRGSPCALYYDVKGRQLRVEEAFEQNGCLVCVLNHPIEFDLSAPRSRVVLFKAGGDSGIIDRLDDDGRMLVFREGANFGPRYRVKKGESIHIRHPSLKVKGPLFTVEEQEKIVAAKRAGFTRYFLSYAEESRDIDALRELVGDDVEIWLKIETKRGLEFVENDFRKRDGLVLVAARGDLYIELDQPHDILPAIRLVIERDPEACAGSRLLLSVAQRPMPPIAKQQILKALYESIAHETIDLHGLPQLLASIFHDPVPSCADFSELAWLFDLGYRRMLLCDELCLDQTFLETALNAFEAFRSSYPSIG